MIQIKTVISLVFFLIGLGVLYAQEGPTAAGGVAIGPGGTTSYSVGQLVYSTDTGTNGGVAQGVQQAYEISVMTGLDESAIRLELDVYPNPTTDFLILNVEKIENLNYKLIDINGETVNNGKIVTTASSISVKTLPSSIYFLQVVRDKETLKVFKIIKN